MGPGDTLLKPGKQRLNTLHVSVSAQKGPGITVVPVVPLFHLHFGVSLLKLNIRAKGTLIIKGCRWYLGFLVACDWGL